MNNDNSDLETVNMVEIPEAEEMPASEDSSTFQTIDPTEEFETIDPTAEESPATVAPTEPEPVVEEAAPVEETVLETTPVETAAPDDAESTSVPPTSFQMPRANAVDMSSFDADRTRYNPVTGEEMDVKDVINGGDGTIDSGAINNEEHLKTVEVEYKPSGKGNTVLLIFFFIGLIVFVVFLPNIQTAISLYRNGTPETKEVMSGTLICKLTTNTVNLDHTINREFVFSNKKLQNAKFRTEIRGDANLDEEVLNTYYEQCSTIRDNVKELEGVAISCDYTPGKVIESETFDYSLYDAESVSAAYTEAGGSVLEFTYEQDIDKVMTLMLQGGFECEKKEG